MKYLINDIKDTINKENKIYWFLVDKKENLLSKGNSKSETKKKVLEKIKKKDKYNNKQIYRLSISFHSGKKVMQGGKIGVHLETYSIINGNMKKNSIYGKVGMIWFEDSWLEYNGWDKKYLLKIIKIIKSGVGEIVVPGINYFHLLI